MINKPFESAKAYAITLLSRRAYTEKGLCDKLAARYGEETAAAVTARMTELDLLDDEDYARRYLSDLTKRKGMSPQRAAYELARKGIGNDIIKAVTGAIEVEPQAMIARIVKRRYMLYLGDEKGRRKTENALLRLGYNIGDILAVMRNLDADEDYYEDWVQ